MNGLIRAICAKQISLIFCNFEVVFAPINITQLFFFNFFPLGAHKLINNSSFFGYILLGHTPKGKNIRKAMTREIKNENKFR